MIAGPLPAQIVEMAALVEEIGHSLGPTRVPLRRIVE